MEPINLTIIVCVIIIAVVIVAIAFKALEHRCKHEWEIVQELPVHDGNGGIPVAYLYVLRCKKCGDIKRRQVKYRGGGYDLP